MEHTAPRFIISYLNTLSLDLEPDLISMQTVYAIYERVKVSHR